jgi:hypothetical protein
MSCKQPSGALETTMKDPARSKNTVTGSGAGDAAKPYKRDFWDKEKYFGEVQSQKIDEIKKPLYEVFSNIQPLNDFRESLAAYFKISPPFPASRNWNITCPIAGFSKPLMRT